jgi:glycosyltransferase involved in cell wall biosynthesis
MKILYGITKSNFGGAQRYVFDLAKEAKKAGHDVAVLCGGEGSLVSKLKAENIRVLSIPDFGRDIDLLSDAKGLLFILRTVRKEKPDVFHINSAKMGGAGIFSGRLLGISKIIFTAHGWAFNEPRPLWQKSLIKFFSWLTVLNAHKTICVAEQMRERIAHWPFIKDKLVVVRNGIENFEMLTREEARKELGVVNENTFLVGGLSELHPIKGLDILIEAWGKFAKNRDARLINMGTGEMRHNLEELAKLHVIGGSFILKGYVENAKRYLQAFDLFVLPSRSEAMPYSILEAGLASLPVVASAVGGLPEIIESGVSGILVEKENTDDLFSTLVLLYENAELRTRLGNNLKHVIETEFTIEKMASKTFDVYLK